MEKQKSKPKKDAVNVTKIYETIKDKGFIQDLWLDIMSDMKEKPSYKRLKGMVEKVIESSVENYATKPKDPEERLKTRTIFTDLSIMTYTIDTLISELLYKKLKDEFKSIVSNIVEEIKTKPISLVPENGVSDSMDMLENIGKIVCNGKEEPLENEDKEELSKSVGCRILENRGENKKKKRISRTVKQCNYFSSANSSNSKEDVSIKNDIVNVTSVNLNSKSKKLLSNQKSKAENNIKFQKIKSQSNYSVLSKEENSDVDIMNVSDDDDENCSFSSVSSVHTSDLSSFEDDVSISSEDENGVKIKKHVPLKLATNLYAQGRLSELQKTPRKKRFRKTPPKVCNVEKSSMESPNQRLSARTRKPNLKYASDDVVCPIKQLLPQTESYKELHENSKLETPKIEKVEYNGKRGRPRKVTHRSEDTVSCSSEDSSTNSHDRMEVSPSLASSYKANLSNQEGKPAKRGRPPKNKNIVQNDKFCEPENETEAIRKRGRPPKIVSVRSLSDQEHAHSFAESLSLIDKALYNHPKEETLVNTQIKNSLPNPETELKRKRGRPLNESTPKKVCEDPVEHSVESFSQFEERLCLKDQKLSSPPKNSTKSYSASDLYKPRSDFRVSFNNSKGSKALTLFSN